MIQCFNWQLQVNKLTHEACTRYRMDSTVQMHQPASDRSAISSAVYCLLLGPLGRPASLSQLSVTACYSCCCCCLCPLQYHLWLNVFLWGSVATLMSMTVLYGFPFSRDIMKEKSPEVGAVHVDILMATPSRSWVCCLP